MLFKIKTFKMTNEEIEDLTEFVMTALYENGFGDVANEIQVQLKEGFEEFNPLNPKEKLLYILSETVQIFNNFSNRNYQGLVSRLNRHVEGNIEGIEVVLALDSKEAGFNLQDLPDYSEISEMFEGLLGEISNDKNDSNDNS